MKRHRACGILCGILRGARIGCDWCSLDCAQFEHAQFGISVRSFCSHFSPGSFSSTPKHNTQIHWFTFPFSRANQARIWFEFEPVRRSVRIPRVRCASHVVLIPCRPTDPESPWLYNVVPRVVTSYYRPSLSAYAPSCVCSLFNAPVVVFVQLSREVLISCKIHSLMLIPSSAVGFTF